MARKPPTAAPPAAKRPAARKAAPRKAARPTLLEADKSPGTPRKKTVAAGPKMAAAKPAPRTKRKPAELSALDKLQAIVVACLEDDKAENIVTMDLEGKAAFCDRMVIATGLADRQITAMAQHLQEKLHQAGVKHVPIEGAGGSDWVLIDAGDIVVHLFKPEARTTYALEKMWGADFDAAEDASAD